MKKIVVTGGSGFIGTNLVNYLLKKKIFVINIDNLSYASNKYNKFAENNKNYRFYKTNIGNKKKIKGILNKYKPECIFNLAAETHVDRSIDQPLNFIETNILSTFNFLETVRSLYKQRPIKLIHISTDEVYGDLKPGLRSSEEFPYNPSSPYAASKASSDLLIKSYIRTYKFPAIITNCCNNYGPFQFPEKLLPKMISNILNNKVLPIYAKGKNSREWIFVEDHCEALFNIYKKGKIGQCYNIGSGYNLDNLSLILKLINQIKQTNFKIGKNVKIKFVKDRPGHDIRYALNNNKIRKQLKWKAKTNITTGLKKTIAWYIQNPKFLSTIPKKLYNNRLGLQI